MVTKAEIQSIDFNSNTCEVRMPIFESSGVNIPAVATATISHTPGIYNSYKAGDVVFVEFDTNSYSNPVVIGKLYLGTENSSLDPRGTVNIESLNISRSATLPTDTKIVSGTNDKVQQADGGVQAYDSLGTIIDSIRKDKTRLDCLESGTIQLPGTNRTFVQETEPQSANLRDGDLWVYTGPEKYDVYPVQPAEDKGFIGFYIKHDEEYVLITVDNFYAYNPKAGEDIAYDKKVNGTTYVYGANTNPHWTTVLSEGQAGKAGSKQLGTIVRNNFTDAQWDLYGTLGRDEDYWDDTSELRAVANNGDIFMVSGTSTDTALKHVLTHKVILDEDPRLHGECISHIQDGEKAISYWVKVSTPIHQGTRQKDDITITAYQKVGDSSEEVVDSEAYLEYSLDDGATWNTSEQKRSAITILRTSCIDKHILVKAIHKYGASTVEYDRQTITYSPVNTPVLSLDNDTASLAYDTAGNKIGTNVATSTAAVYLNGEPISGVTFSWTCDKATMTGTNTSTVTVSALSDTVATIICAVTNIPNYTNLTLTKNFTVAKQIRGDDGEDGQDGNPGISVTDYYTEYILKASGTTPTKAESGVKNPDDLTGEGLIWTREVVEYSDGTITRTDWVKNNAYALAQGKSTTYYSDTAPSSPKKGDCWFDTSIDSTGTATNALKQWDGGKWVDISDEIVAKKVTAEYINAKAITANKIHVIDTAGKTLFKADGTYDSSTGQTAGTVTLADFTVGKTTLKGGSGTNTVGMCSKSGDEFAFWAGADSGGNAPFHVGHDGSLYSTSGTIGGFTIDASKLSAGSNNNYVALQAGTAADTIAMWAGHATAASAPFYIKNDGSIKATSGTFGPWTLDATGLSRIKQKEYNTSNATSTTNTFIKITADTIDIGKTASGGISAPNFNFRTTMSYNGIGSSRFYRNTYGTSGPNRWFNLCAIVCEVAKTPTSYEYLRAHPSMVVTGAHYFESAGSWSFDIKKIVPTATGISAMGCTYTGGGGSIGAREGTSSTTFCPTIDFSGLTVTITCGLAKKAVTFWVYIYADIGK